MKELDKPRLELNKRTIARLNNLEMRNVRGGDGGNTDISAKSCEEIDTEDIQTENPEDTLAKKIFSMLLTKIFCG